LVVVKAFCKTSSLRAGGSLNFDFRNTFANHSKPLGEVEAP
jgi:hypothetical protein